MLTRPAGRSTHEVAGSTAPVLVTGAGGFIGSAVVDRLVSDGRQVRALVGPPGAAVRSHRGAEVRWAEITDQDAVAECVQGVGAVVHLAGPPGVAWSFAHPAASLSAHAAGSATVARAAVLAGVDRLVHVSSAEVYALTHLPVIEDSAVAPRSPYAIAKWAGEQVVRLLCDDAGLPVVVLRPFSVYGPGSPPESVVGRVCAAVAAGRDVVVADLVPVRDYVHVDDVTEAIVGALGAPPAAVGPDGLVLNVCSGSGVSVAELAATAVRAGGTALRVRTDPTVDRPSSANVQRLVGDPGRALRALGWRPSVPLDSGLAQVVAALRGTP